MRSLSLVAAALTLIATPAFAAPACKDAKGKFTKCPPAPVSKPTVAAKPLVAAKPAVKTATPTGKKAPCRDAKGRFKKC